MNGGPERKDRTGRLNQPPQPECGREEGQAQAPQPGADAEQPPGGVPREARGPQADVALRLSDPAPKRSDAGGEGVILPEPNTKETDHGEVSDGLPGSPSVARAPDVTGNLRDPADSRRTHYGSQAGKPVQRPGGRAEGRPGVLFVSFVGFGGFLSSSVGTRQNHPTQPITEFQLIEIDQQADRDIEELHVAEQLRLVDGKDFLDGFQLQQ